MIIKNNVKVLLDGVMYTSTRTTFFFKKNSNFVSWYGLMNFITFFLKFGSNFPLAWKLFHMIAIIEFLFNANEIATNEQKLLIR